MLSLVYKADNMSLPSKFKTLLQLLDYFKDEETCRAYYEKVRWGNQVTCPYCECTHIYRTNRGYKCGNKECHKKFSLTVGTIFENTKIPLRTWFAALYLCTTSKKGISSVQLAEQLGITQKSSWFLLSRIRTMLAENSDKLTGEVEIDETYVGGKDVNKHKSKRSGQRGMNTKVPIVGCLQRAGIVVLRVIEPGTANGETIKPLVRDMVCTTATIITDGFGAYSGLGKEYEGHEVLAHEKDEYVRGNWHTNSIEGFWSIMKRGIIGIYHCVSAKHMHRYCNEFAYRYNTRDIPAVDRFILSLTKASSVRITYLVLIGKRAY